MRMPSVTLGSVRLEVNYRELGRDESAFWSGLNVQEMPRSYVSAVLEWLRDKHKQNGSIPPLRMMRRIITIARNGVV
jgi:hypothetical protein